MIATVAACGLLAACSADKVDYRTAAEKVARETVEGLIPGDATAECGEPDSTDVGTTFDCTGTAIDGTVYSFSAEITKDKEVTVTLLDTGTPPVPTDGSSTTAVATPGSTAGTTAETTVTTASTSDTLPSEDTVAESTTTAGA